jgi:hypothetical protein
VAVVVVLAVVVVVVVCNLALQLLFQLQSIQLLLVAAEPVLHLQAIHMQQTVQVLFFLVA